MKSKLLAYLDYGVVLKSSYDDVTATVDNFLTKSI